MSVLKYRNKTNPQNVPPGLTSLDRNRREVRDILDQSSRLKLKIFSSQGSSFEGDPVTFYSFDTPSSGVEISLTFTLPFGRSIDIVNFGDGTSANNIKNNQTVTHTY